MSDRNRFRATRKQENIDKYLSPKSDTHRMFDLENPDIGFFNRIDSELIRLAGSQVLVFRYTGEENYDDVLDEDPMKVYDPNPALVDCHYDPRMFEEPLADFGIEMSNDQTFTFNKDDVLHQLGREIKPGDIIFSKFQNTLYEVTEVQEDSFESYGVYHLVASAKVLRIYEKLLRMLGLTRFFRGHKKSGGGDVQAQGLKDLNLDISIGLMANEELIDDTTGAIDSDLSATIATQATLYAVGNKLKWRQLIDPPTVGDPWASTNYDFTIADRHVDFAENNNLLFKGHTLLWSKDDFYPNDFNTGTTWDDIQARNAQMSSHVQYVVTRYAGRVHAWDVLNEVTSNTNVGGDNIYGDGFQNAPGVGRFQASDAAIMFEVARDADPDAVLILNDFKNMGDTTRTNRFKNIVTQLLDLGAPVSAVGFQAHIDLDPVDGYAPTEAQIQAEIDDYASSGLDVYFTEIDISASALTGTYAEKQQAQKDYVKMLTKLAMTNDNVKSLSFWGVSNAHSWKAPDQVLPFDDSLNKLPMYYGVQEGILENR